MLEQRIDYIFHVEVSHRENVGYASEGWGFHTEFLVVPVDREKKPRVFEDHAEAMAYLRTDGVLHYEIPGGIKLGMHRGKMEPHGMDAMLALDPVAYGKLMDTFGLHLSVSRKEPS